MPEGDLGKHMGADGKMSYHGSACVGRHCLRDSFLKLEKQLADNSYCLHIWQLEAGIDIIVVWLRSGIVVRLWITYTC